MGTVTRWGVRVLAMLLPSGLAAQDTERIDTSKPTNLYSFLDNALEINTVEGDAATYGYRGILNLAPHDAHLIVVEVPLMYARQTEKFGVGDTRLRYFGVPYKNYDKFIGAFGGSVDIFAPTGSFENGLGTSRWVVAPGVYTGFMLADWIQAFTILSYQYSSKQTTDQIPEVDKQDAHGLTFQVITPIVFSSKFFMQFTPILALSDLGDDRQDRYRQEINVVYAAMAKLQFAAFWAATFADKAHTFRLSTSAFF